MGRGLYYAGRGLGRRRLRRIADRMPLMGADDVEGHQLGSRWTSFDRYSGPVNAVVYALIAVAVGVVVVAVARRVRHRRRDRAAETPRPVSRR